MTIRRYVNAWPWQKACEGCMADTGARSRKPMALLATNHSRLTPIFSFSFNFALATLLVRNLSFRSSLPERIRVRVLLIEDHKPLLKALQRGLEEEGFAVDTAEDGETGEYKGRTANYDAVVLDLMLPKKDGLTVLREWRKAGVKTHVLVLTAKDTTEDKVKGLDVGADDYLTKPFQLEELLARLRALIRRSHQIKDPVVRIKDMEIDTSARTVKRGGQAIHLTPREFALLQFLAYHRGKVVSRTMIWEHLYDEYDENTSNVVDVYIRYLRTKIDKGHETPLILTRWGEGYMLRSETD
jgi:DNA-binding response OmpR family regulator